MTVQAQNSVQYYNGPIEIGTELSIVEFTFIDNSHVSAKVRGNTEVWEYGYDYTISGAQTLIRTITVQRRVAENEVLAVYLDVPITQNISPEEGGNFPASTNEYVLDKLTHISQMLDERVKRSLQISIDTPFSGTLPAPEPNKALKISSDGNSFVMSDYDPDLALVLTENFKNQAQQAAIDALSSQTAAANSETVAIQQSQNATIQAANAKASADNAAELNQQLTNNFNSYNNSLISTKEDGMASLANASNALRQIQVTNCLLEVPQRIKLELNEGVLTLKAGSVAIAPYGTEDLSSQYPVGSIFLNDNFRVYDRQFADGKFFVWAEVQSDMECVASSNMTAKCFIDFADNTFRGNASYDVSGDVAPTANSWWYDTANNTLGFWVAGTQTFIRPNSSFPLSIATSVSQKFTSIDQVFNGMGYIGSTIWVDKGVKGLAPSDRNKDGTLKNIEVTSTKLTALTNPFGAYPTPNSIMVLNTGGNAGVQHRYIESITEPTTNFTTWFNPITNNQLYRGASGSKWTKITVLPVALLDWEFVADPKTNTFTSLVPKQPFRAVDYNDKSEISGWAMPSSKYIDLTLGASGSTYTVPANGWVQISKFATAAGQDLHLSLIFSGVIFISDFKRAYANGNLLECFVPVFKRSTVRVGYSAGGATEIFRFIYAQGEV